jgi:hypothetical protein
MAINHICKYKYDIYNIGYDWYKKFNPGQTCKHGFLDVGKVVVIFLD